MSLHRLEVRYKNGCCNLIIIDSREALGPLTAVEMMNVKGNYFLNI